MTRFEAVCEALADLEPGPFSARTLFEKVKTKGSWADGGIWIEIAVYEATEPEI